MDRRAGTLSEKPTKIPDNVHANHVGPTCSKQVGPTPCELKLCICLNTCTCDYVNIGDILDCGLAQGIVPQETGAWSSTASPPAVSSGAAPFADSLGTLSPDAAISVVASPPSPFVSCPTGTETGTCMVNSAYSPKTVSTTRSPPVRRATLAAMGGQDQPQSPL